MKRFGSKHSVAHSRAFTRLDFGVYMHVKVQIYLYFTFRSKLRFNQCFCFYFSESYKVFSFLR